MATNDLLIRLLARDQASPSVKGLTANLNGLKGAAGAVSGALAGIGVAVGAAQLVRFSAEAVGMAANAQQVEGAFRNLTASVGISANTLLGQMEAVAGGWATNAQLMQTANLALQGGTAELVQQLPRLFEVARAAAVASGQDVLYVYDTLVRGIIRGSPLLIDNANIFVKVGDAQEQYAASIGKTVEQLSAQEKQLSLLNAVMGDADRIIKATGVSADSAAERMKNMATATAELKTAWGELLLSAGIGDAVGALAHGIGEITDQIDAFGRARAMEDFFRALGDPTHAQEAQRLAMAVKRLGDEAVTGSAEWKLLVLEFDRTRGAAAGTAATFASAINPTTQWADALAALNMRLMETSVIMSGIGPMSPAGPISPLLQNQSVLPPPATVEEWSKRMLGQMQDTHDAIVDDAKESALDYGRSWQSALYDVQSMAASVLRAGLQETALDMAQTQAGTYQDKPLEAARRLADIAARGLESPWAAFFEIPPDVLAAGADAVKAWASQVQGDVENLTRPDLIDWDAFVSGFEKAQQDAAAKELTLDIAVGKLAQAGLLDPGTKEQQKQQVAKMLGIETPELAAAGITAGFRAAFEADNPAIALMNSFTKSNKDNATQYETAGKASGKVFGKQVHDAALAELDPFMDDLADRVLKRLPNKGEPPP